MDILADVELASESVADTLNVPPTVAESAYWLSTDGLTGITVTRMLASVELVKASVADTFNSID